MEFIRIKRSELSLDMAPLIDVVFQLLIFFMLSSSFLNPSLKLTLPRAAPQDASEPEHVVVSADKGGRIFINQAPSSLEALISDLGAKLADNPRKAVHLRGDAEMPYKLFVEIMDRARRAGARQIHIVHQPEGEYA